MKGKYIILMMLLVILIACTPQREETEQGEEMEREVAITFIGSSPGGAGDDRWSWIEPHQLAEWNVPYDERQVDHVLAVETMTNSCDVSVVYAEHDANVLTLYTLSTDRSMPGEVTACDDVAMPTRMIMNVPQRLEFEQIVFRPFEELDIEPSRDVDTITTRTPLPQFVDKVTGIGTPGTIHVYDTRREVEERWEQLQLTTPVPSIAEDEQLVEFSVIEGGCGLTVAAVHERERTLRYDVIIPALLSNPNQTLACTTIAIPVTFFVKAHMPTLERIVIYDISGEEQELASYVVQEEQEDEG